jgi:hypothetical protein
MAPPLATPTPRRSKAVDGFSRLAQSLDCIFFDQFNKRTIILYRSRFFATTTYDTTDKRATLAVVICHAGRHRPLPPPPLINTSPPKLPCFCQLPM